MRALKVALVAGILGALIPASGAQAQPGEGRDERITISGPVVVEEGETAGDVVVFHGSATIDGRVDGDLVVFDGPVEVSGTVNGDLVSFSGPVTLRDGAEVTGDVVHRGRLNSVPGAEIGGESNQADFREMPGSVAFLGRLAAWIGFTVSIFVVGLLILWAGPRLSEGLAQEGLTRPAAALGWGLVAFFGIPVIAIASFLTLVGIPLGFALLFGFAFLLPVGYATSALVAGRKIMGGPGRRFASFAAGLAILRLLALVPVLGGFIWFVATSFGLGILATAAARTRSVPSDQGPAEPTTATPS